DTAEHHWDVRLGGQRAIVEEVLPVGPFALRQQQYAPAVIVAQTHLLADLAEHPKLVAHQVVRRCPRHTLQHGSSSHAISNHPNGGWLQGRKLAEFLSDLWRGNTV